MRRFLRNFNFFRAFSGDVSVPFLFFLVPFLLTYRRGLFFGCSSRLFDCRCQIFIGRNTVLSAFNVLLVGFSRPASQFRVRCSPGFCFRLLSRPFPMSFAFWNRLAERVFFIFGTGLVLTLWHKPAAFFEKHYQMHPFCFRLLSRPFPMPFALWNRLAERIFFIFGTGLVLTLWHKHAAFFEKL